MTSRRIAPIGLGGLVLVAAAASFLFVFNSAQVCGQGGGMGGCGSISLIGEKQTIQAALDAMLEDQHVPPSSVIGCEINPTHAQPSAMDPNWTDQMTAFPPGGAVYTPPNPTGIGVVTAIAPHYLRQTLSISAKYICDQDGNVYQLAK